MNKSLLSRITLGCAVATLLGLSASDAVQLISTSTPYPTHLSSPAATPAPTLWYTPAPISPSPDPTVRPSLTPTTPAPNKPAIVNNDTKANRGAPAPARSKPVVKIARPASPPRNRLIGPNFNVRVDTYSECTAAGVRKHPLPHNGLVALDTCMYWDRYFVGHNPGPFTPLLRDGVGSIIAYYNSAGVATRYQIKGSQYNYGCNVHGCDAPYPPAGTTAQFQTCVTPSSSIERIYYAVTI